MDILEWCPTLETLNGYEQYTACIAGKLSIVDLSCKELALAMCRFFPLCKETLTSLDLRHCRKIR